MEKKLGVNQGISRDALARISPGTVPVGDGSGNRANGQNLFQTVAADGSPAGALIVVKDSPINLNDLPGEAVKISPSGNADPELHLVPRLPKQ